MIPCFDYLRSELEEATDFIGSSLSVDSPFIGEMAKHFLSTLGQRIRPSLVLAFSRLHRRSGPASAPQLAAMTELVHSASLLHDDVVDKGRMRRNRVTVNVKWGNKEAVLLGDLLLSRSLKVLAQENDPRIIGALYAITASLSEGQLLELENFGNRRLDEQGYLRIIELKTAVFFAESCLIGALAAKAPEAQQAASREFGLQIGYCYQILDDLLDVTASLSTLGKDIQNDLLHGKMTLPYIFCLGQGEGRELLDFPAARPPAAERVASYIRRSGAYDYCLEKARGHAAAALSSAARLEDAALQATLQDFVAYLFSRMERFSAATAMSERPADSPTAAA
ncbi:MAG: polyprenyl synthetase family protein [Candidatus Wallbacteria bacterium]|nr:polyprenyl synthetase family protein [Candidatus Wallbacteria bacterium]